MTTVVLVLESAVDDKDLVMEMAEFAVQDIDHSRTRNAWEISNLL